MEVIKLQSDFPNEDLSIKLIGNKDLKFKLLGDTNFINLLIRAFSGQVKLVLEGDLQTDIAALEKSTLILRTLSLFVTTVNLDKHPKISSNVKLLQQIISPIIDLFQHRPTLNKIVSYSIDTLLSLTNSKTYTINSDNLCVFVISSLNDDGQLLVKVLHLIPLILLSSALTSRNLATLLKSLLERLSTICDKIILRHLPNSNLHGIAYSEQLPNVELNKEFLAAVNIPLLTQLIIGMSQIFSYLKEHHTIIVDSIPTHVYLTLQLLVKNDNKTLSLGSLNLINYHLISIKDKDVYLNYKKLFPRIIAMLDNHLESEIWLSSPAGILIDICSQYPLICEKIRDTNLDLKIISKIETLYTGSNLLKELNILKKLSNPRTLVDFTTLLNHNENGSIIEMSNLIYLLSIYGSTNDNWRSRIINTTQEDSKVNLVLSKLVFDLMDNYHFLLQQWELVYRLLRSKQALPPDLGKNLGIIISLMDSPLYMNALYLSRSLSRSLSALRTFFVECNSLKSFSSRDGAVIETGGSSGLSTARSSNGLVINFLQILKIFGDFDRILRFFQRVSKTTIHFKNQMVNKSTLTGILANFIIDFSSFRYSIVSCDNFLQSLAAIYKKADENIPQSEESKHQMLLTQLNVMQVIKNYMFNETNENKSEILDFFPLISILENTFYGFEIKEELEVFKFIKLQKKLASFDILRNFTAGSPLFAKELVQTYESSWDFYREYDLPPKWFDYVVATLTNFRIFTLQREVPLGTVNLMSMIMNEDYVKLVTSINYIEDHKYITVSTIEREWFPHDNLLSLWIEILELDPEDPNDGDISHDKVTLRNNLNEIKLLIIWILINLTWKSSTYGFTINQEVDYSLFEALGERAQKMLDDHAAEEQLADGQMSVIDRAKYLKEFGFPDVLTKLIEQYSEQPVGTIPGLGIAKVSEKKSDVILKRFDIQNSYDLLEKLKTAHNQISGLVKGKKPLMRAHGTDRGNFLSGLVSILPGETRDSSSEGRMRMVRAVGRRRSDERIVRVPPDVRQVHDIRDVRFDRDLQGRALSRYPGDVNRGGEGFGYDSLDELDEDDEMEVEARDDQPQEDYDEHDEFWIA